MNSIYSDFAKPSFLQDVDDLNKMKGEMKTSQDKMNSTSNPDGTINISQDGLDNPYSGYSEGPGSGPETKGGMFGGQGSNSFGSIISNNAGAIGGAFSGLSAGFKPNNSYVNSEYVDSTALKEQEREKQIGTVKDSVASVIGPIGSMFREIEKAGNAAGESVGGEAGSIVSAAFSPDEAIMANNSDPDVSTGDKILGTILPFHAALSSNRAKVRRKEEFKKRQQEAEHAEREQQYRQKDGLDALAKLTDVRKRQEEFLKM